MRVFVSSTFLDLKEERFAAISALKGLDGVEPIAMEHFGARTEEAATASLAILDRCQGYVGIFANRYGSGVTEQEYRRALELCMPCFIFFVERPPTDALDPRLVNLKAEIERAHVPARCAHPHALATKITAAIYNWHQRGRTRDKIAQYLPRIIVDSDPESEADRRYFELLLRQTPDAFASRMRIKTAAGAAHASAKYTAIEAVEELRKLVMIGPPGSGKSTALRRLAMTFAQRHDERANSVPPSWRARRWSQGSRYRS